MEQVISLINRLEQQVKQGAATPEILAITGLLRRELEQLLTESKPVQRNSVAVWLPPGYRKVSSPVNLPLHEEEILKPFAKEEPSFPGPVKVEIPEPVFAPKPPMVPVPPQVVVARESLKPVEVGSEEKQAPVLFPYPEEEERVAQVVNKPEPVSPPKPFPQYPDVATLMKNIFPVAADPKPAPKEVNELVVDPVIALNEKLQEKKVELADILATNGTKIGDIRKAITINEKYQMISSLFRGDEDMFERSVRTLNNFGSLPEARFWMQRELVVKLGWKEEDELVQHFYRLVSRRFA